MPDLNLLSDELIRLRIIDQQLTVLSSVGGGCINSCYKVQSGDRLFFLKENSATAYPGMFGAERAGLDLLRKTNTLHIPNVVFEGDIDGKSYLLMDFIASASPDESTWRNFGQQLARLHQTEAAYFGWDRDNYIGSLVQTNKDYDNWTDFYLHERLIAQLEMGIDEGWADRKHYKQAEGIAKLIESEFPREMPSLLHGDLWSGNYMMHQEGEHIKAVLVDPAVYYGHREMDMAFSQLFGGFHPLFYEAYQEIWPIEAGFEKRRIYHQLYPLMVHANLFGGHYVSEVRQILAPF